MLAECKRRWRSVGSGTSGAATLHVLFHPEGAARRGFDASQIAKRLIGPPRPAIVAGTLLTLSFLTLLFSALAIADGGDYRGFFGYMALLGSLGWLLLSAMTMRIAVTPSKLLLINRFTVIDTARSEVSRVEGKNGVVIYTRSGRRCVSAAYGSSRLQKGFCQVTVMPVLPLISRNGGRKEPQPDLPPRRVLTQAPRVTGT